MSRKVIIANTQKQGRLLRKDRKGIIASTREIFALRAEQTADFAIRLVIIASSISLRAEQTADCAIRRVIIASRREIIASRREIIANIRDILRADGILL